MAFLNFLTNLTTVVGAISQAGTFYLDSLGQGRINYGKFLLASPFSNSANTGFNFSPSRDMSEAVFWNPSAVALSRKLHNISLFTNIKNTVKLGGFYRVNPKIAVSIGGIYNFQDEIRKARFAKRSNPANNVKFDSTVMKLKEYAVFLSTVYKINNKFLLHFPLYKIHKHFYFLRAKIKFQSCCFV